MTEILRGFNLPPEEHEEYLVAMLYHLQIALDAYLSRFREPQDSNVQIP